jgi:hypothetical protein
MVCNASIGRVLHTHVEHAPGGLLRSDSAERSRAIRRCELRHPLVQQARQTDTAEEKMQLAVTVCTRRYGVVRRASFCELNDVMNLEINVSGARQKRFGIA